MELIPTSSPWYPYVSVDPDRLGGEPVFKGTRVPIQALFDYLSSGQDLEEFLRDFDGVLREHAVAVLSLASQNLTIDLKRHSSAA